MKALTPAALTRAKGLFAYSALPFPRPTQYSPGLPFRPQPRDPSDGRFISRLSAIGHSRLRPYPAGSPRVHAETGSCSYRLAVRLQLLPTPPLGDAVTFGYKVTTHSDRDFHPADKASSRTHWMAGTCPAMTSSDAMRTRGSRFSPGGKRSSRGTAPAFESMTAVRQTGNNTWPRSRRGARTRWRAQLP
jgi:hypothetical protein